MIVRSAPKFVSKTLSKPRRCSAVTIWPVTMAPGSMPKASPRVTMMSLLRPAYVSAAMPCTSLQARMQRPQRMHFDGSRTMAGFVTMRGSSLQTDGSEECWILKRLQRRCRSQFWLRGQERQSLWWLASMSCRMATCVSRTICVSVWTSMPSQTSVEQAASKRRLPTTSTEQRRQRALMRWSSW